MVCNQFLKIAVKVKILNKKLPARIILINQKSFLDNGELKFREKQKFFIDLFIF